MTRATMTRACLMVGAAGWVTGIAQAQTVAIPAGEPATTAVTAPASDASAAQVSPIGGQATAPSASAAVDSEAVSDIVVTGSRIVANGYKAPTPVTVVSTTELLKKAPESIAAGLATLPQFFQSSGANVTSSQARETRAGNYLNLRALGEIETLVLLDGQRLPPTSYAGTVDANIIPQALIQRVDVVTGGASAAYGSDAVAGVVNFVLDTKFEGIKGSVQYGKSARWDDHQVKANIAVGKSLLDNRLHLEASFDYFFQPGIANNGERPYGGNYTGGWVDVGANAARPCPTGSCAANPYTPVYNVRLANGTYGLLINSGRNLAQATQTFSGSTPFSFNGYTFDQGGGFHKADLGTLTGTPNFNVGGADTAVTFGTTLTSRLATKQGFARADYDFGGGITGFFQGSYSDSKTQFVTVGAGTQFQSFQIFSDNAFLPTAISQAMQQQGVASFVASRVEADQTPKRAYQDNSALTLLGGLKGKLANFNWSVTGSYGDSDLKARHSGNFQQSRWFAALDAVRDPTSGAIVCRTAITNPGLYPGCVPWNPFGNGSPSQASYNYFQEDSKFQVKSRQSDFAANVSGAVFDLPAGPVNIALGAEYRHQYLNMTSNNDPSKPIDLTGLRTYAGTYNLTYNSTNQGPSHGTQNVKEGYGEIAIPILRDKPFFQALDLNGAARYTNYSVSGGIWAWKGGFSWTPVQQIRFRGTVSRDIRAPTLNELFAGVSSTRGTFTDVHTGLNTNLITLQQGNKLLKPERGDTMSFGAVWQPEFIPGFSASLDYYHIKIKDQITTLSNLDLNQRCEDSGGTDPLCQYILRPLPYSDRSAANFPTSIAQVPFNQAALTTYGFDYELNYRMPMGHIFNGETSRLDLRFIGNFTPNLTSRASAIAAPLRLDGTVAGGGSGVPRHKFTASAQLTEGPLSFGADVRFIGVMHYTKQPNVFVANNRIPAVAYLNANISYDIKVQGHQVTLFANGTNLTDKFVFAPQLNTQPTEFYPTYQSYYDVVGAYFVVGARFKI
ncbi:TonB-dependent receptor plug domain-containing protein [Sphingomonas nostoxanthinifaciens]|uniref:TonB-dependent receptor plug domain-containing protein n=1 Tax=Sphingomonas nostoxanthinifaciens TaxID=2872652 RepID=UPI001CC1CDB3|nr:TonB-dependent receptor [Sphingomonas nostoxanthinifaciens]UAK24769.1 TonB-dependent receptor [Sphingomonas nostoxanthinifaciens]